MSALDTNVRVFISTNKFLNFSQNGEDSRSTWQSPKNIHKRILYGTMYSAYFEPFFNTPNSPLWTLKY